MKRCAINPGLRRSYDLRGRAGTTLDAEDAHGVGRAFAAIARQRGARTLAVSRDGRLSSPELEAHLLKGLVEGGMRVTRLPPGPTPLMSFAIRRFGLDGGVMVTGSHNPADQNGFKFHLGGHPLHGPALGLLWQVDTSETPGGAIAEADAAPAYIEALTAELEGCRIADAAWDTGNGAAGPVVAALTRELGPGHRALFAEMDGHFPNHHPDPSVPANLALLREEVTRNSCDLGIAFDGDGDRIGVVDAAGQILFADQLMLLLARDVLSEQPGSAVVADVKSSDLLFSGIEDSGGRAVMAPSGYVLIRERMLAEGAVLAGEMSGHIFFGDRWHHADDALYVAMRTLRAIASSGSSLRAFRESLPERFATPEIRFDCPAERKQAVIAGIACRLGEQGADFDTTDGLRVRADDGWWLLRSSGTEDKLTARCEARSETGLDRLLDVLSAQLRSQDLEPELTAVP